MREGASARSGEAQDLKAMRERTGMTALAAIFDVVMDRVIVGRDGLKSREIGVRDRAARDVEALVHREILEKPAFRKAVPPPVEPFVVGHVLPQTIRSPEMSLRAERSNLAVLRL